ncbi:MAG: hypothetical protein WCQ99_01415 [Pseudomonadota bacterium]
MVKKEYKKLANYLLGVVRGLLQEHKYTIHVITALKDLLCCSDMDAFSENSNNSAEENRWGLRQIFESYIKNNVEQIKIIDAYLYTHMLIVGGRSYMDIQNFEESHLENINEDIEIIKSVIDCHQDETDEEAREVLEELQKIKKRMQQALNRNNEKAAA